MANTLPSLEVWRLLVALLPYRQRTRLKKPIGELERLAQRIGQVEAELERMNRRLLFPAERLSPARLEEVIAERKRLERELASARGEFDRRLAQFIPQVAEGMDLRRCAECGLFFRPRVREHQFCSPTCRNRHWRRQHAQGGQGEAG